MYRPAARSALRSATRAFPSFSPVTTTLGKRFASTSPANARRSWKSSALRWGIAIGGLYYYTTSPVFAEQPQHNLLNPNLDALDDEHRDHATLEALTSRRSQRAKGNAQTLHSAADSLSSENASTTVVAGHESPMNTGAAELEEEAASEGAFNPETGEINWDCPCLGGMADGPCGPEFKEAFSCFVFSEQEPKGMDCIDKFQNMQGCFQKHPEVYKGELEDDEELSAGMEEERQELVNEIAERKRQQSETGSQTRLLEEPDPVPRSKRTPTKVATPELQPHSSPSTTSDTITLSQESDRPPSEDGKAKVNKSQKSTLSPDRENVVEEQKSNVTSEHKRSSAPVGDHTTDIVPRAAFDAISIPETQK